MPWPLIETPSVPGKCVVVTGKKRDGKSYAVYNRIFVPFKGPKVYIDPKGADPYIRGEIRHTVDEVKSHPSQSIIFRPRLGSSPTAFDEEVEKLIDYLISWKQTYPSEAFSMLIVVDESQRYMGKAGMEEGPDRLVQTCSALNISTVMINPDYMTVPRQLYVQSDYCIFFTAHKVLSMYLDERMMTTIPAVCMQHLEFNRTEIMTKKGYGIMYDWHAWWKIYPDGHMDGPISAEDEENEKEGNIDDSDDTAPTEGKGTGTVGADGASPPAVTDPVPIGGGKE